MHTQQVQSRRIQTSTLCQTNQHACVPKATHCYILKAREEARWGPRGGSQQRHIVFFVSELTYQYHTQKHNLAGLLPQLARRHSVGV